MIGIKERSLSEALSYCFLSSLPEVENKKDIWIRGIALVQRRNNTKSYVYVERDPETMEVLIKKDFGSVSSIVDILECYPFLYLDANFIPEFKDNETRISYLNTKLPDMDFSSMKKKELDKQILKICIKEQLAKDKNIEHE